MSKKVNVVEFEDVENQVFEKTSKRNNRAVHYGKKEEIRNKRKLAAKRKGRSA